MHFLKRLLGLEAPRDDVRPRDIDRRERSSLARSSATQVIDSYFANLSRLQAAISRHEFDAAAQVVRDSLRQIPDWVNATRHEFGAFDIRSIPALEQGGVILALVGDVSALADMRRIVGATPELAQWTEQVDQHQRDQGLFQSILTAVQKHPACLQSDIKSLIGEADGHRIATLVGYLEKSGKLVRVKAGRTYKLMPPGSEGVPKPAPKRLVGSHRTDRTPPKLHEIDISKLSYVPLPRAPLRWQEERAGRERAKIAAVSAAFEIRDAPWQVASIEKIPSAERPDPAFRQMYSCGAGLLLIDDLGKSDGASGTAAAMCYDRNGQVIAKTILSHDIYRVGVHPLGHGMAAISRDCVLHAYDDHLNLTIETALAEAPEVVAISKRFNISNDALKNHIRCVALSRDSGRYLFTVVDEAWCIGSGGEGIWGAKLPFKDGWKRLATPSSTIGTTAEVNDALGLMDLRLPVTPEGVKQRYRELAKRWHPDINPGDPRAGDRMKSLNAAAEVLTGIDTTALPDYTGTSFVQELSRNRIRAGGLNLSLTVSIQVSEIFASDWIYAAAFATKTNSVYLAGYSGRVVLVDELGLGVRVYDIGAVPRQIVDTGTFLYILTDTRLYVLQNDALHSLLDTFDGGDLIVAEGGFGLRENKRIRWHGPDGQYIGSVVAKDPIRRVYYADGQLIVESRQARAAIRGFPNWWQ